MQIAAIILSLLVFTAGVFLNKDKEFTEDYKNIPTPAVTPENNTLGLRDSEDAKITETVTPVVSLTPTPTPTVEDRFSVLMYPGAEVLSVEESEVVLQSEDDTDQIVSWYKNQINNNYNGIKNFVVTKTNGVEKDKLTFYDGKSEIFIEISKPENNNQTEIGIKTD